MSTLKTTAALALTAVVAVTGFAGPAGAQQDLRNADRRAPAVMAPSESTGVSLPAETIDGAPVIQVPQHGFDWGDAGIGAGGGLAIVVLAGTLAVGLTHRRRGARVAA